MACACKNRNTSNGGARTSIRKSSPMNNGSRRNGRIVKRMIK